MSQLEQTSSSKLFGGWQNQYQHQSSCLNCTMRFSVYLPPQAESGQRLPVLYWLSGLTCSDENFVTKAGAQCVAAELGIILVIPDTSPRGDEVPDDEAYDLGKGAGFYVNATQAPWDQHYHMYDYIVNELPALITAHFNVRDKAAIAGHSMGGHGALVIALANQQKYTSVSAFAPIVNPLNCAWGQKAFRHYLGDDQTQWQQYDACHLLQQQGGLLKMPMKVDQGLADNFLESQSLTRPLQAVCDKIQYQADFGYHPGYDHSYYFISSFIEAHLRFHYQYLQ
ncbi:S-formylglutathione hydrolase [Neptunicella sp. SCSIO 80796]|uniref:S-formylglutathione hydrolase n=1 Tax=Neptunicella plasticusilytica TaxID=3117012 RepID=UPI003A4DA559